ncbi:hypothetical protein AB0I28_06245 [Phytomonospora sp. NPDC050363]|uniref:hypothetical protein n=1 Tax=Phytomonospora sp. NPDC050363 TaxID=3155642 RepID=UPI0033F81028
MATDDPRDTIGRLLEGLGDRLDSEQVRATRAHLDAGEPRKALEGLLTALSGHEVPLSAAEQQALLTLAAELDLPAEQVPPLRVSDDLDGYHDS